MKIKRYDMYGLGGGRYTMNEHLTGAFVRYADHAEVDRELEESRREFRAADATIHNLELKLTDLAVQLANAESKCSDLAAENAGLKNFIINDCHVAHVKPETFYEEEIIRYVSADGYEPETPATDAHLAEVRASARNDFIGRIEWIIRNECNPDKTEAIINELQNFSEELKLEAAQ
ncbi:hypothetical protein [Citrobacter sp. Cb004]|uniref:hypothetical protein n=1 Tax=Citrobacter sp. Cb004 TaxID=2985006 RepID=UPI0025761DF6|nr:hypothetical protein [Citrobacter sp. Cb004]MDM3358754.1 hypothetical protein [Citrobacter sp. Cb004]